MKKIEFTVLIPVYNTKAAELIESVYSVHKSNQTIDQDYDIVLVDDGSDNAETCHAIEFLKIALGIEVLSLPKNAGTSAALNVGHDFIKTEYIAISGSSDISFPDRFKRQVEHIQENPDIDVLGTQLFSFVGSDVKRTPVITTKHLYRETLVRRKEGWLANHGTVMYKNDAVKEVGGYQLPGRYQDVDLWKRMHLAGKDICNLNQILYAWRR